VEEEERKNTADEVEERKCEEKLFSIS